MPGACRAKGPARFSKIRDVPHQPEATMLPSLVPRARPMFLFLLTAFSIVAANDVCAQPAPAKRPMTFLDMQEMRQVASPTPSTDGRWLLYTLSTPDWKEAKRQTDIHLVSLDHGLPSAR